MSVVDDGRIHHVTTPDTWARAVADGTFTESTLDRSLEDEGFVHCCDAAQLDFVLTTFYAAVPHDLLLLTIDPELLESRLVREVGNPETGETFPHVYGPINPSAVVATRVLHPPHGRH
ncbi:hypothetical protein N798_15375 [Knoellia flava TL1]|uniref:DUF952 domain-containing protein n=2 Tax=Knoellia flava TaxID=913969 RepID=A0A8H9KSA4_9MICO|nr:DUF952 domain-containing protein [Knoellia flava]KGN29147.1 hypothetical protein N798_15375 [Knoellia flava TL1]GGB78740.1 hypothetical protein GCM10011314_17900 [Knoellia flava]